MKVPYNSLILQTQAMTHKGRTHQYLKSTILDPKNSKSGVGKKHIYLEIFNIYHLPLTILRICVKEVGMGDRPAYQSAVLKPKEGLKV